MFTNVSITATALTLMNVFDKNEKYSATEIISRFFVLWPILLDGPHGCLVLWVMLCDLKYKFEVQFCY